MNAVDEEGHMNAHLRLIYAMDRINRVLEVPDGGRHNLPDETIDLVVSCINAISEMVERRLALDSSEADIPDEVWQPLARAG